MLSESAILARQAARIVGSKKILLGCDKGDLSRWLHDQYDVPAFRAQQVIDHVVQGARDVVSDMRLLPLALRQAMQNDCLVGRSVLHRRVASSDGTMKFLLRLHDGLVVESAAIPSQQQSEKTYKKKRGFEEEEEEEEDFLPSSSSSRLTACISSQVGCAMKCSFCATGKGGFARNLMPHEMLDQVMTIQEHYANMNKDIKSSSSSSGEGGGKEDFFPRPVPRRVSHVVMMGMGEPLLNLPSVVRTVQLLTDPMWGLGLSQRNITISTVGIPNTIVPLANATISTSNSYPSKSSNMTTFDSSSSTSASHLYPSKSSNMTTFDPSKSCNSSMQCTLAISLHAPNQHLREHLVPSARSFPLPLLMQDCLHYAHHTKRRITFEYVLLSGVNDTDQCAHQLTQLLHTYFTRHARHYLHVNLLPWNPVQDAPYQRPTPEQVRRFEKIVSDAGIPVTVRTTRGLDANAACGQLRNEHQTKETKLKV